MAVEAALDGYWVKVKQSDLVQVVVYSENEGTTYLKSMPFFLQDLNVARPKASIEELLIVTPWMTSMSVSAPGHWRRA